MGRDTPFMRCIARPVATAPAGAPSSPKDEAGRLATRGSGMMVEFRRYAFTNSLAQNDSPVWQLRTTSALRGDMPLRSSRKAEVRPSARLGSEAAKPLTSCVITQARTRAVGRE